MFGLEDLPHPPLADRIDDAVRPQGELGAAVEQLLGLPGVQQAHFDQPIGELLVALLVAGRRLFGRRCTFRPAKGGPSLGDLLPVKQAAGQGTMLEGGALGHFLRGDQGCVSRRTSFYVTLRGEKSQAATGGG